MTHRWLTPLQWRFLIAILSFVLGAVAVRAFSQPPGDRQERSGGPSPVARLMQFDANKDGELERDEVTDERLQPLFRRADADGDGIVTKDELELLSRKESSSDRKRGRPGAGGGPGSGPPGSSEPGGPGGQFGQGGRPPGGDGRRGPPPPRPGQILPPGLQDELGLTEEQRTSLSELQSEVDTRLAELLTDDQRAQLKQIQERGPRRPGPGRPGGQGDPGARGDGPRGDSGPNGARDRGPDRGGDRPPRDNPPADRDRDRDAPDQR